MRRSVLLFENISCGLSRSGRYVKFRPFGGAYPLGGPNT